MARIIKTYNSKSFLVFSKSTNLNYRTCFVKTNQRLNQLIIELNKYFYSKTLDSMVDEIDFKIIDVLKTNSRLSYAEIGKQISLSPSSVRERVKKMEDSGLIKGYTLQLNQSLMGNNLEAFIMLKIFSGRLKAALVEIESYPEVKEAFRITGQHNLYIRIALKDQLHLQKFIDKLVNFGEPTTHLILSRIGEGHY